MKRNKFNVALIWILLLSLSLTGCLVRTYKATKERVDQGVGGNRGYFGGSAPPFEASDTPKTRQIAVLEIEMHPMIRFGKAPGAPKEEPIAVRRDRGIAAGNRGYLSREQEIPSIVEEATIPEESSVVVSYEAYEVKKGDTLQKISKKFYGGYSKWQRIFEANKDKLNNPDGISPGQILRIPQYQ